jgi:hypothetical protein
MVYPWARTWPTLEVYHYAQLAHGDAKFLGARMGGGSIREFDCTWNRADAGLDPVTQPDVR